MSGDRCTESDAGTVKGFTMREPQTRTDEDDEGDIGTAEDA